MSGLCGLVRLDGAPAREAELDGAFGAMGHRGPDGRRAWSAGSVAFGHLALHTTAEAREERQPVHDEAAGLTLVFDGRLDERDALRRQLTERGFSPRDGTDAELALRTYACFGEAVPEILRGDFAIAVWDARRRRLFLARDIFGARPLHYFAGADVFVFASEAGAVVRTAGVPCRPDETRIADFLVDALEWSQPTHSMFEGVLRVPHASSLSVSDGRVRIRRYWLPDPERRLRHRSDAAYAEGLREVLTAAVRSRLRAEPPAGSMLSGGIDSSVVVGLAREVLGAEGRPPLDTFSVLSGDETRCFEAPYVRAVLSGGGLRPHVLHIPDLRGLAEDFEHLLRTTDDPYASEVQSVAHAAYLLASRAGCRVVFDGIDGDLIASAEGHTFIEHAMSQGRWHQAWAQARALGQAFERSALSAFWAWGLRSALPRILPPAARRLARSVRGGRGGLDVEASVARPDFLRATGAVERLAAGSPALWLGEAPRTPRASRAAVLAGPIVPVALSRYERLAAVCGIEPRHPLLDRRVVEYCLALPLRQRTLGGWSKSVLRRAGRGRVPQQVLKRLPTFNLSPPAFQTWAVDRRTFLGESVEEALPRLEAYVDAGRVRRGLARFAAEQADPEDPAFDWQAAVDAVRVACLGHWHRRWIDVR